LSEIIGVVGAGTMGNGIAQVAARAGYDVILHDVRDEFIERGFAAIEAQQRRQRAPCVSDGRERRNDQRDGRRHSSFDIAVIPRCSHR